MRILWLHQYFATPKGWGAVRTYEFARRFVRAGHAVDVVCCAGYDDSLRPAGRAPLMVDGVRVFVSGTAYRPQMGFARRVVSFLRFMAAALWFVLRRGRGYDVVIASSGPLTLAVPALVGRWLWRVPYVFEAIDVWPDSAIAAGVLKNPVLKWLSFRLEALAYRYAAAIVTCSTGMTERVEEKLGFRSEELGVGEEGGGRREEGGGRREEGGGRREEGGGRKAVVTISNCCDLEMCAPDEAVRRAVRLKYGVREDQTVVLYSGAMGRSNAMADVAGAVAATADDERIVWWFAGDGPERGYCDHEVVAMASVKRYFGRLAKEEVVALVRAADVNVVTFRHEPLFFENSPNKFFDGIAAGVPALFNRSTWLEPWLKAYDCGIVCKGERPGEEMAAALRALAGDPARRRRMGLGARRLAEEVFDRDKLAAAYLAVLLRPRSGRNGECKNGRGVGERVRGACDGEGARRWPGEPPG